MTVKYSIVIPTYNHCDDLLKPCLESIKKYTDLSKVEVLVVANGCNDNTHEYVNSLGHPFALIIAEEPLGYTKATNIGMSAATGEYIVLLNNDTVLLQQPTNNWLDILELPFIQDSSTGITGPVKFTWDCGGLTRTAMAFWLVMFSRSVFEKVGYLDEIFSPGMGEDGDYCIRIEQAGYKQVSVPSDLTGEFNKGIVNFQYPIYHKGNGTFADNNDYKNRMIEKNIKILEEKYGKKVDFSIIIPTAHNYEIALKPCLDILLQVTDLSNKEVIVVANGSPKETKDLLDSLSGRVKYVWFDQPIGCVRAYNEGIKVSRGRYIITLDDDSILLPQPTDQWINVLHKPFTEQENVGATSPFANEYEDMGFVLHSGCTMYDGNLLRQLDMFDEIYHPGYFCDSDISMKIWNAGYKCVEVPVDRANKDYKNGVFSINFPVVHTGSVQTMNKHKDIKLVEKNRQILYSRYGKKKDMIVATTPTNNKNELDYAYNWCLNHDCDINQHFPVLLEYAKQCKHITEFGTRGVFSTYAFMAAKPNKLITYDINVPENIWTADRIAKENNIQFAFMERDTTTCDVIEHTDLLFIDTWHTYKQLTIELARHSDSVRKYIILHDTESYGYFDEGTEPGPGLVRAIDEFVKQGKWKRRAVYYFNNGLTILERT